MKPALKNDDIRVLFEALIIYPARWTITVITDKQAKTLTAKKNDIFKLNKCFSVSLCLRPDLVSRGMDRNRKWEGR